MSSRIHCVFLLTGVFFTTSNGLAADGEWSAALNNECVSPDSAWIWCEDFETDRSADYFEGAADRQPAAGINGSVGSAWHFTQQSQSASGIKIAFGRTPGNYFKPVDGGTNNYRDIYWRIFVFVPGDWVGNGADKLSRAMILAGDNWSQAMIAHVWSGTDPGNSSHLLAIDPTSGTDAAGNLVTTQYNDSDHLRWLGIKYATFAIFSAENFGTWHCVESRVRLNDPDQANGIFQLYINNNLEADSTGLNWVGNYGDYGINAVFFENYWNNGSPVDQTRYFDNLVISTRRIGCGTSVPTPMPPGNLN